MRNLKTYNLEHTNTVTNAIGRRVWGYLGIEPLISPCDCYASAYRIDPALLVNIKDTTYSVASLLRSKKLAARYTGDVYKRQGYGVSHG